MHDVEARVVVPHVLGVADLELDGDVLLGCSLARGVDENRGEILSDDLRATLGGDDRDCAGTRRRVEHAFARLRIASLDHERVDVANRVRDALVRPVPPDNALPRFQLCKGHGSSSRLDGPGSIRPRGR